MRKTTLVFKTNCSAVKKKKECLARKNSFAFSFVFAFFFTLFNSLNLALVLSVLFSQISYWYLLICSSFYFFSTITSYINCNRNIIQKWIQCLVCMKFLTQANFISLIYILLQPKLLFWFPNFDLVRDC